MPHYRLHRDPKSSHQQISRRVRELAVSPVLDVGAAQGMFGQLLENSGIMVDAVEPNAQWAEESRKHYRNVMIGTIEQVAVPDEKYKVIVCADVLEHTPDPVSILKKIHCVAAPDALYIVSVPNVAHLAVRLMLLAGRFPKMDRGILDRTHLQFLTKDTAEDMLRSAGLRVERVSASGIPLDELWPGGEGSAVYNLLMGFQHVLITLLPRWFGMQFIFEARRADVKQPTP